MVLTVYDMEDAVVRRVEGPATPGLHRVAWDLRYPSVSPWAPSADREPWESPDVGFLVMPGTYRVELGVLRDGELSSLSASRTFEVRPLREGALPRVSPAAMSAFHRRWEAIARDAGALHSRVAEHVHGLDAAREVLLRATGVTAATLRTGKALRERLADLEARLETDRRRDFAGDPGPVSLSARFYLLDGLKWSTHGPTAQHAAVLDLAAEDVAGLQRDLAAFEAELTAFLADLDALGVPWSPGR